MSGFTLLRFIFCQVIELNHLKGSNECKQIMGEGLPKFIKKELVNKVTTFHRMSFDATFLFLV